LSQIASNNPHVKLVRESDCWLISLHMQAAIEPDAFASVHTLIVEQWQPEAKARCVVDLHEVSYLGSILLGLLINIRTRVRSTGGTVVLCGLPTRLLHVVRTASLDRLFDLYPTRTEAMKSF